jgi:2-polyprenyl-3-methyl-5-hydroxy-6-metoxy-1,4-benzoquinol methylase
MESPVEPYRPREFWQDRLSRNFDLRGTGEPGLSEAYNERCYRLRAYVLQAMLAEHHVDVRGKSVLDAGCGTGFFVEHFLSRGARVSGVDLTDVSVANLSRRFPEARFEVADLSAWNPRETYDLVSCFDVLFHIVDDDAWERALTNLVAAVKPGGWLAFSEIFLPGKRRREAHNTERGRERYRTALLARGMAWVGERPTHHLMNRPLGPFRFLNRVPDLLYRVDLTLLMTGVLEGDGGNRLVLARKPDPAAQDTPAARA